MAMVERSLGGYITYALASREGKRGLSTQAVGCIFKRFERWAPFAVAVPALLPPPFPIVPGGGRHAIFPQEIFVAALMLGRAVCFHDRSGLGAIYGRHFISFFSQYYRPALFIADRTGVNWLYFFSGPMSRQKADRYGLRAIVRVTPLRYGGLTIQLNLLTNCYFIYINSIISML